MRIDVTKPEFEAIVNRLKGLVLRSEQKLVDELARKLDWQLHPSKAPDKGGYAPIGRIKPSWPSGLLNPDKKSHWSYHKPRKSKKPATPTQPKKPLTADEILNLI